ncbi:hypothetical protein HY933_04320 [Candidatus Falkowbacteria bacterium]|nr:hypothetical protein [Candidatus Falkowbacteria bacterium]
MYKRSIVIVSLLFLLLPVIGLQAQGSLFTDESLLQGQATNTATEAGYDTRLVSGSGFGQILALLGSIIRWILMVIGLVFFILIIYAGVQWMTASGNEEQLTKAKGILQSAIIGLVIVFAAYAITLFVTEFVSKTRTTEDVGPTGENWWGDWVNEDI